MLRSREPPVRIHRRRNGDVVGTIAEHVVVAGQVGFHCPAAASAAGFPNRFSRNCVFEVWRTRGGRFGTPARDEFPEPVRSVWLRLRATGGEQPQNGSSP
ncbi:hypothetical protein REA19_41430 [Prescottella equi]|nr:hypothetical protein REA19_41430 [Prescottella equi]